MDFRATQPHIVCQPHNLVSSWWFTTEHTCMPFLPPSLPAFLPSSLPPFLSPSQLGRVQTVASRRNWVVLRKDSPGGGKSRLELYRNEDLSGVGPVRTILLDPDTVKGINTIDKKKAFLLTLSDDVCLFQCSSRADMDDWYKDLSRCRYNRSGSQGGGALPDKNIAGEIYDGEKIR